MTDTGGATAALTRRAPSMISLATGLHQHPIEGVNSPRAARVEDSTNPLQGESPLQHQPPAHCPRNAKAPIRLREGISVVVGLATIGQRPPKQPVLASKPRRNV
jgi:hypothetical protein